MEKVSRDAMIATIEPTRSRVEEKTIDMSVLLTTPGRFSANLLSQRRSPGQLFLSLLLSALLLATLFGLPALSSGTDLQRAPLETSSQSVKADRHAGWSKDAQDSSTAPIPGSYEGFVEEKSSESADELTRLFGFAALHEVGRLPRTDTKLLPSSSSIEVDRKGDLLPPQLLNRPPPPN